MQLKRKITAIFASFLTTVLALTSTSKAAPYAPGDLVLFFFQEGGTQTIYANLDPAHTYRSNAAGPQDAVKNLNILNLKSAADSTY